MGYIYNWTRMTGAPATNDLHLLIDVSDTTDGAEGTNKLLEGKYGVYDTTGTGSFVDGGGTIALNGYTLTISDSGTIDLGANALNLGGNLTTDGTLTIAGAVISFGGQSLTIAGTGSISLGTHTLTVSSPSTLNLNSNSLALSGGNLAVTAAVAGSSLTLSSDAILDANGNTLTITGDSTLNLGGNTLTSDGDVTFTGTSITIGGQTFDLTDSPVGTPGADNKIAMWGSGLVEDSNITQAGIGNLTLNTSAGSHSLNIITGGTLNLNTQQLTLTGTGTLDLGVSNKLAVKTGDLTVNGGGTINLGGQQFDIVSTSRLDMNGFTLTVDGGHPLLRGGGILDMGGNNVNLTGAGTLDLGGFTATVAKTGTVAMLDDATNTVNFGVPYNYTESGTGKKYPSSILFDPAHFPSGATFEIHAIAKKDTSGVVNINLYRGSMDDGLTNGVIAGTTIAYNADGHFKSTSFSFTAPTERALLIAEFSSDNASSYNVAGFQMVVS